MNNQTAQQQKATCELCHCQVDLDKTCAGTFGRICKKCYDGQIDDLVTPMHFISEGVYLGTEKASRDEQLLVSYNIKAVCVCGSEIKIPQYQNLMVERKIIKILDTLNQTIIDKIPQTVTWIQEMRSKNLNVLIHCVGGVSRSASFCIAYFMKASKLPYQDSHLFVKRNRKCIKPNQNFIKQLRIYQQMLNESKQSI